MTAAKILREARRDGLDLTATANGTINARGPCEAVARWRPVLAANKPAILEELRREAAEVERLLNWWREPIPEWRESKLTIRNLVSGKETTINLREGEP